VCTGRELEGQKQWCALKIFVNLMFLFNYYVLIILIYIYRRGSHEDLQAHDIDKTRRFFVCGVVGFGCEGAGAFT
jgi:hypothetical protein